MTRENGFHRIRAERGDGRSRAPALSVWAPTGRRRACCQEAEPRRDNSRASRSASGNQNFPHATNTLRAMATHDAGVARDRRPTGPACPGAPGPPTPHAPVSASVKRSVRFLPRWPGAGAASAGGGRRGFQRVGDARELPGDGVGVEPDAFRVRADEGPAENARRPSATGPPARALRKSATPILVFAERDDRAICRRSRSRRNLRPKDSSVTLPRRMFDQPRPAHREVFAKSFVAVERRPKTRRTAIITKMSATRPLTSRTVFSTFARADLQARVHTSWQPRAARRTDRPIV